MFCASRNAYKMIIFAHSKCKRYENRKIQGVALPEKERNGKEWKSSHHGTHHGEQDYGAVLLQVVLHSIALESSCQPIGGQEIPFSHCWARIVFVSISSPSARCSVTRMWRWRSGMREWPKRSCLRTWTSSSLQPRRTLFSHYEQGFQLFFLQFQLHYYIIRTTTMSRSTFKKQAFSISVAVCCRGLPTSTPKTTRKTCTTATNTWTMMSWEIRWSSHNYLGMQISKPQLNCHVTPNQLHGCTQYTYFAPDNRSMVQTVTTIPTI